MSETTHIVIHKRLYLSVNDKLQHIPQGSPLTLSNEQAEKLGDRVKAVGDVENTDLTKSEDELKAEAEAKAKAEKLEALRAEAKALGMTGFGNLGVEKLEAEIKKVEAAIEAGNQV